jgi:drug/metabolite transporter (DMT)-like permease
MTSKTAMVLVALSTLLLSFGQLLFKKGVDNFPEVVFNLTLISGFFLYGLALIILLYSLKKGELSVLYPIFALSYVWVLILSGFLLNEAIAGLKIVGVGFIFVGVSLIGRGS